jgi:hypothetical protein
MNIMKRLGLGLTLLALSAGPAFAQKPEDKPAKGEKNMAAPGQYCKAAGAAKKKVEGQKKSAFAECVTGQAKLRQSADDEGEPTISPRQACKDAAKKKAEGQKKSSFATCVKAAKAFVEDAQTQS